MIDASRSPRPLWRRCLTLITLAAVIGVLSWAIWVKELHHPGLKVHALGSIAAISAPARTL